MSTLKRVILYVGMVIAALVLVATSAGIIAVWAYNTPVTETILQVVVPASEALAQVETLAGRTNSALEDVSEGLAEVDQQVQEFGDEASAANIAVGAASALVGEDITPKLEETRENVLSVYDTIGAFYDAIGAVRTVIQIFNAIPFIDFQMPGDEELGELLASMEGIVLEARTVRDTLQERQAEIVDDVVELVREPLDRLDVRVTESRTNWADFEVRAGEAKEQMIYVQENAARWVDLLSIGITLLLLWIIVSQVAVFVLCRNTLRDRSTV